MLIYRYLMFKMREFTLFVCKITHFKHFTPQNSKFFIINIHFLEFFF